MTNPTRKIRVLVVDDSAVVRKLVTQALASDPEIEVTGAAGDPYAARDQILKSPPDVLTLDLEMPRMDGLTFLKILMEQRPLPVVVISSLTKNGSQYAMEALRLGAVDVLGKPDGSYSFGNLGPQLIAKVKAAAGARLRRPGPIQPPQPSAKVVGGSPGSVDPRALVLLGASTGGTEAIREVLEALPVGLPPIAIVQHIPAAFSRAFAERLNHLCAIEVSEARDGEVLEPGHAYVGPGDFHLLVQWSRSHYAARVVTGPPVWHQRPAVDLLFKSAVEAGAGPFAVAGVLTGMGKDGADGLLRLREHGAVTFGQDEASCVVYGMPRAAWECGAVQRQLPLDEVARFIRVQAGTFESIKPAEIRTPS